MTTAAWTADRAYSWLLALTDLNGKLVQTIDTMPAFTWLWDLNLDVSGAGSFDIVASGDASVPLPANVPWEQYRLRLSHVLYPDDGPAIVSRVAFATPSEPGERGPRLTTTKLVGTDATANLNIETDTTLDFPPGLTVTTAIKNLYDSALVARYAITPHAGVLTSLQSFPPRTKLSTVINTLARTINYGSSWADADGVVHMDPYIRPSRRPTAAVLVAGDTAMHTAAWTVATSPRPNRLVSSSTVPERVEGSTAEPQEPWYAFRTDPVDSAARGRWITYVWDNVAAADEATFDTLVSNKWEEIRSPADRLTIQHAYDPRLVGGANFEFNDQLWTIIRQEIRSDSRLVTTTARGVPRDEAYREPARMVRTATPILIP